MDPARLEFWKTFLLERSAFPMPDKLARQLAVAAFPEFCDCGCNSFAVRVPPDADVPPLTAPPGRGGGAVFQCAFLLKPSRKSLELIVSVDAKGNLDYVEIDCNGNSEPVPLHIDVEDLPYHVHASETLLA